MLSNAVIQPKMSNYFVRGNQLIVLSQVPGHMLGKDAEKPYIGMICKVIKRGYAGWLKVRPVRNHNLSLNIRNGPWIDLYKPKDTWGLGFVKPLVEESSNNYTNSLVDNPADGYLDKQFKLKNEISEHNVPLVDEFEILLQEIRDTKESLRIMQKNQEIAISEIQTAVKCFIDDSDRDNPFRSYETMHSVVNNITCIKSYMIRYLNIIHHALTGEGAVHL